MRFCNPVKPVRKPVRDDRKYRAERRTFIFLGGECTNIFDITGWLFIVTNESTSTHTGVFPPLPATSTFAEDHVVVSSPGGHNYAKKCPSPRRLILTTRLYCYFVERGENKGQNNGTRRHNLRVRHPESRGRDPGITAEGYYDHVAILRFVVWRHEFHAKRRLLEKVKRF